MLLNEIANRAIAFTILFSAYLIVGLPGFAQTEPVPSIAELPMRPIIKGGDDDFPWFKERFGLSWRDLENNYSVKEVDAFLDRWRTTFPNDPEAWISSANWNWRRSQVPMMYQADPQPGMFVTEEMMADGTLGMRRVDGAGGNQSSFVTEGVFTDTERYENAASFYNEGVQKFPYRVDLYDIITDFHLYFADHDALIDHLKRTPSLLRNAETQLEQTNYQPVQVGVDAAISGIFHRTNMKLMEKGEARSMQTFLESAQLMTRAVPDDPVAWTDLVGAQYNVGNKRGAYSAAQRAYMLAPEDEIVVLNLATLSLDLGLRKEAIELNNWLIENATDPHIAGRAHAELELMSVEPK